MSILNSSVSKKISVKLSLNEINEIKLYIKGAVDGFCNINNGETFFDVGVLLKQVLSDDVYWEYELIKGYTNEYRRIVRK